MRERKGQERLDIIKKLTSLFLAVVLFSCSNETVIETIYAAGENENTGAAENDVTDAYTDGYSLDETGIDEYGDETAALTEQSEDGEEAEDDADEYVGGYTIDEGIYTADDEDIYKPQIEEENDTENDTHNDVQTNAQTDGYTINTEKKSDIMMFAAEDRISLYAAAAYTLTQDEIDAYATTQRYAIEDIDDWLRIEALSKIYDFKGKEVMIATPKDSTWMGKYMLTGTGFTGLGSAETPFAGYMYTSMQNVSVNCDCPLIAYMSTDATLERLVLGLSGGNAGIAGTLVCNSDEDVTIMLKGITVTGYLEDNTSEGVGGLFGTVINNGKGKLTIDAANVSANEDNGWGGITMNFSEHDGKESIRGTNVGTYIGKMVGNVEFNVNSDFEINVPSLYGTLSTGGVVGRMEMPDGADVTDTSKYPTIHFKDWSAFNVNNIYGTGYNGGVVGYINGANIWNDTENSTLEIKDTTIEGGKAAGGFVGCAAYTNINGTGLGEIKVDNSKISCVLTGNSGVGVAGGFIGEYGDGNSFFNNVSITVDNVVFSTATSGSAEKYMGGFVGKYNSTDDIVITAESKPVTIQNVYFEVRTSGARCGGFVSYVPKTAGTLKIDTSLYLSDIYLYIPDDCTSRSFTTYAYGGVSSIIESDNLEIKNLTLTNIGATVGQYEGSIAGQVTGDNSVFDSIRINGLVFNNLLDGITTTSANDYNARAQQGVGSLVGRINGNTTVKNITAEDVNMVLYTRSSTNSYNPTDEGCASGGLIGILGKYEKSGSTVTNLYSKTTIENITISGTITQSRYYSYRYYIGGIVGYVRQKTALEFSSDIDLSGIENFNVTTTSSTKPSNSIFVGKIVGSYRDALVYLQPDCNFTWSSIFDTVDDVGDYGGVYRNETFWDDESITDASSSTSDGTLLIVNNTETDEIKAGTAPAVKVTGSVGTYGDGWGMATLGDYIRFSIVSVTAGFFGMEPFGTDSYDEIMSGTFTAVNDMNLSARYSGIVCLTRNDLIPGNRGSSNYNYSKLLFRGTFKGMEGEGTTITLPGFPVYRQSNIGLFSSCIGATFKNLRITGTLQTVQTSNSISISERSSGALVATAYNGINVENVTIDKLTTKVYEVAPSNSSGYVYEMYIGNLIGRIAYDSKSGNNKANDYLENYDYVSPMPTAGVYAIWNANIKNVTVRDGSVELLSMEGGSNYNAYVGGLIGAVKSRDSSTGYNLNLDDVLIKDENIYNADGYRAGSSYAAGLISYIYSNDNNKINCNFNDVMIDNVNITTATQNAIGGLWGYEWTYANIKVTYDRYKEQPTVQNCKVTADYYYPTNPSHSYNTSVKFGGLLYKLDRSYMDLTEGLRIDGVNITAEKSTQDKNSFLVSLADTSMILLKNYRITNSSVTFAGKMFDEIAGSSKNGINERSDGSSGMGLISLSDSETPFSLKNDGTFHTYTHQLDYSGCPNIVKPYYNIYTRYYYNLDEIIDKVKNDPIKLEEVTYSGCRFYAMRVTSPEQLMIWHLMLTVNYNTSNSYMAKYFNGCFDAGSTGRNVSNTSNLRSLSLEIDGKIDMTGMSFYPTYNSASRQLDSSSTSISSGFVVVGAHHDTFSASNCEDEIIFDYDNINKATNQKMAEAETTGEYCTVLRSNHVQDYYYASSQEYRLHTGLFTNSSYVNAVSGVAFGGSIGSFKYDGTTEYSGVIVPGLLNNVDVRTSFNNIVLDGLYVVNPNEDYDSGKNDGSLTNWQNYYGLLLGGWDGTSVNCVFDTIVTTGYDSFVDNYPNKKAAAALIGRVGTSSTAGLKKFEFKNMSIADAEEDTVLTANGTNISNIHADKTDQIMAFASYIYYYAYSTAEKGFYNFYDADYFYGNGQFTPQSGNDYYITLGKELGDDEGTTKTEYYNTESKVGTASYDESKNDSDYIDFSESNSSINYWLDFSNLNYKPYIYNYGSYNINVNYKSGDLTEGCGTYEDPYIISNERQLYSLYCYLAGGGVRYIANGEGITSTSAKESTNDNTRSYYPQLNSGFKTNLNEWKVNIPGTDDEFCTGEHEALTYNYEENPITGFEDETVPYYTYNTGNTTKKVVGYNSRISVNILRNAYYKITNDIDMSNYTDFYGLCRLDPKIKEGIDDSAVFPFTGVIIGEKSDGSAPVIKMPTFAKFAGTNSNMLTYLNNYGFISSAKGCVVKNLEISYPKNAYGKTNNTTSEGQYVFGGIIGTIWGGDNIIDNVKVNGEVLTEIKMSSIGSGTAPRQYMGGFVGSVRGGSLILRNLSTDDFADFNIRTIENTGKTTYTSVDGQPTFTEKLNEKGAQYMYINALVGRVTNGYVLAESVDEPSKRENDRGEPQMGLDDSGAIIDFSQYEEKASNKMYVSQTVDVINGKYFEDSGKIKISRTRVEDSTKDEYDFTCDVENAKQLMLFAQTLSSGGFYTNMQGHTYYTKYRTSTTNDLAHVYTCATSKLGTDNGPSAYDVYSRCRKAKYDTVGNTDESGEDYQYAKKYDNINNRELFNKYAVDNEAKWNNYNNGDYRCVPEDAYKNYIGYNYMLAKYYDFYNENDQQDEFWIIRRGGLKDNRNNYTVRETKTNPTTNKTYTESVTCYSGEKAYNIFNCYGATESYYKSNSEYQIYNGGTTLNLAQNEYDMSVFKKSFRGVGIALDDSSGGVSPGKGGTFTGSVNGNNSDIKLDIESWPKLSWAGLFPYWCQGTGGCNASSSETYPVNTMKDLNLSGSVANIYSNYAQSGAYAGMLCGYVSSGRYRFENINVDHATVGAYSSAGGMVGYVDGSAQVIAENCTVENVNITDKPDQTTAYTSAYLGGMFGRFYPYNNSSYAQKNTSYISNCKAKNVDLTRNNNTGNTGGIAGSIESREIGVYDSTAEDITFWQKNGTTSDQPFGGFAGYISATNIDFKNNKVNNIMLNAPIINARINYGGFAGKIEYSDGANFENTSITNVKYLSGGVSGVSSSRGYSSYGGAIGGFAGQISRSTVGIDGIYIDGINAEDSTYTETKSGSYTYYSMSQRVEAIGGLVGYIYNYSNDTKQFRVASLDENSVSATPTPRPTAAPQKRGDTYTRPAYSDNPNKGERNYIKNASLFGRYSGGFIGAMDYRTSAQTTEANHKNIDAYIADTDITENKIVSYNPYRTSEVSNYVTSSTLNNNIMSASTYAAGAGGMIGYVYRSAGDSWYTKDITIEHNVIGTSQNYIAAGISGGFYGRIVEAENTDAYGGQSHYNYNTTLKNNYIGPLDIIDNESQYYPERASTSDAWGLFKATYSSFETINSETIDKLGARTRLFTDGALVSSDSWDYDVTQSGSGEWYAQDNLYRYTRNVGTFAGYYSYKADSTNSSGVTTTYRKFNMFFVEPNIIYDDTEYTHLDENNNEVTQCANAHRPATDVGTKETLTADDDMYEYRDYTHIIYDDADDPTKYGEWDNTVADNVVPEGLGYSDNNRYLFAQLRNIYGDYKKQIADGYIDNADYDEAANVYKLKDNYGQDENGYTMDQVYDYVYYGYERDADGNATSDTMEYLSPYKDKNGRVIPMLVYKAQYGTPDTLINTIINILTNNSGAYNASVGYHSQGVPSILNMESWKMKLEDGVATPVYNSDGSHAQGGFSVSATDDYLSPEPSPTSAPRQYNKTYELEHTSYDSNLDDQNGTFTVLHITYGWDNSGLKVAGNTIDSESVMTLDIPVFVSKLLEVQINMRTINDVQLSEKNIFDNGSPSGSVVLKHSCTLMAEYIYDYPRTMYNSVKLKKKLTFETSPGVMHLYKNTKITLVDITDNDKEYYYYVDKTVSNPQIKFEEFVDKDGNHYQTRDVSNIDDYPKLGTPDNPYTDLRGQTWGAAEDGETAYNNNGIGVEKFLIIIDKSATDIDANDDTAFTVHYIHVRVDDDETDEALLKRIRYDGKDYKYTDLNKPTDDYPNPDWYDSSTGAYNYVEMREYDDASVDITNGEVTTFEGIYEDSLGIGSGKGLKATVDYDINASYVYWVEAAKSTEKQYVDFVISVQSDNKYVTLPVGTKYSFDGVKWYTIGRNGDYEYGKKQIYYYADRYKMAEDVGEDSSDYRYIINGLGQNTSGSLDIYFDFTDCPENSFSDGNYYIKVDAYKTTNPDYPLSGDYQDTWKSDIYPVYNSSNIGFALQEDDLMYRGVNRYLPKVSDNGNISFKAQLDFRKYLDEDTGEIKDVVTNQYYTIGFKIYKKNDNGDYYEYSDSDGRFKFYYDKPKYSEATGKFTYDGVVDDNDPLMWGTDDDGEQVCGVSYKFTDEQINAGSSIEGVTELAFMLKYNTEDLSVEDFSNYKFEAYLYLSSDTVTEDAMADGSSAILNSYEYEKATYEMAEPLEDFLIFTVARLKTD